MAYLALTARVSRKGLSSLQPHSHQPHSVVERGANRTLELHSDQNRVNSHRFVKVVEGSLLKLARILSLCLHAISAHPLAISYTPQCLLLLVQYLRTFRISFHSYLVSHVISTSCPYLT